MTLNFSKNPIEIRSQKTGKTYILAPADSLSLDKDAWTQISKVCDEPEIYDRVFATAFNGKRYTEDNARVFTELALEGWLKKNRFDWLILHKGTIVGTIGIKSPEGEIGYWQSSKHPGVMTLALQSLCLLAKEAGLSALWAYVQKTNIPSIKALEKAGFKRDKNLTTQREGVYGYRSSF